MVLKRGALIVIEGVDRTGKTTQCNKIGALNCNIDSNILSQNIKVSKVCSVF